MDDDLSPPLPSRRTAANAAGHSQHSGRQTSVSATGQQASWASAVPANLPLTPYKRQSTRPNMRSSIQRLAGNSC